MEAATMDRPVLEEAPAPEPLQWYSVWSSSCHALVIARSRVHARYLANHTDESFIEDAWVERTLEPKCVLTLAAGVIGCWDRE